MDGFDRSRARRYALITAVKIMILYAALLLICIYVLSRVGMVFELSDHNWDLVLHSVAYLLPFLLFPLIAYAAGGFEPGDRRRLAGRLAMAVLLASLLFLRSDTFAYGISGMILDQTSGVYAENVNLSMSIGGFLILLAPIPILSGADAVIEYLYPDAEEEGPVTDSE